MNKRLKDFASLTSLTRNSIFHVTSELEQDKKIMLSNLIKQVCELTEDADLSGTALSTILSDNFSVGDTAIGEILLWPMNTAPALDAFYCDGSAVSRSTYSDLYDVIGTDYGAGDGSTTFNVPDLRGYFFQLSTSSIGDKSDYTTAKNGLYIADYSHRHNKGVDNSGSSIGIKSGQSFQSGNQPADDTTSDGEHGHTLGDWWGDETRPVNFYMKGYIVYG